jgi:hypothetical protein
LTVNARSAIVTVPERLLALLFAATLYDRVPLPLPLALEVIVIHDSPLVAVQAHPAWLVMVMVPLPPLGGAESVVGEMSNWQGAAACEIRKRLSLTTMSPSRRDEAGLGAARNVNEPFP